VSTLLLVSTTMLPDTAMACSCARNPTAERILEWAATVFTGVVQQSVSVAPGRSVTTFTVTESFKGGRAGATVRVLHPSGSSASCGVKFLSGGIYTLATQRNNSEPGLTTSLCSTWMFLPQVGISAELIQRMRALVGEK
jgi:hypothetical protein